MIDLLAGRPAQLLAETLLHFLWQGAALALLLKLIEPFLFSVQHRYAASLGALMVMLALPVTTCILLAQRELAQPPSDPQFVESTETVAAEPIGLAAPATSPPWQPLLLSRWQPLFVGLWFAGVLLLAGRLLLGYAATLWLRGDRRPLPVDLALKVAGLERRLGFAARCRVFLSCRVDEAIAVGCFKPLVLIPLAWATELPPSALEAVIAHELAHIRRWDLWATLLQRLAETLLFYHPAVWWLSRRLSQQRELCCDALAVSATRSPAEYVLALETIARRTSAPPLTLATSFLGGGNMNLLDRVRHVLKGDAREASAWWPAGLAALVVPLLAAVALGGWSLLPATVTADEDRDEPVETRAEEDPNEAGGYLELIVRILEEGEKDEESADQTEESLRPKKEAYREEKLRAMKEALDRELRRSKEKQESREINVGDLHTAVYYVEDLVPLTLTGDGVMADFDSLIQSIEAAVLPRTWESAGGKARISGYPTNLSLVVSHNKQGHEAVAKFLAAKRKAAPFAGLPSNFLPATEREERLLEVIKKLQAQLKETGRSKQSAPEESAEGKVVLSEARMREDLLREKQVMLEAKRRRDKETADKEAAAREKLPESLREQKKGVDKKAVEKEVYLPKPKESERGEGKAAADEVETLRRALKEREAQLRKAIEALERARLKESRQDDPRKE